MSADLDVQKKERAEKTRLDCDAVGVGDEIRRSEIGNDEVAKETRLNPCVRLLRAGFSNADMSFGYCLLVAMSACALAVVGACLFMRSGMGATEPERVVAVTEIWIFFCVFLGILEKTVRSYFGIALMGVLGGVFHMLCLSQERLVGAVAVVAFLLALPLVAFAFRGIARSARNGKGS